MYIIGMDSNIKQFLQNDPSQWTAEQVLALPFQQVIDLLPTAKDLNQATVIANVLFAKFRGQTKPLPSTRQDLPTDPFNMPPVGTLKKQLDAAFAAAEQDLRNIDNYFENAVALQRSLYMYKNAFTGKVIFDAGRDHAIKEVRELMQPYCDEEDPNFQPPAEKKKPSFLLRMFKI